MKVYLNRQPKHGPWGGGIKTVNKLVSDLQNRGHEVVHRLVPDLDIIFCIDPRPNDYGEWYQHFLNYRERFRNTKIVQRVGDLGTHSKPELTDLVRQTLPLSDFLIFPSEWARDWIGYQKDNYAIVNNCPMSIFHKHKKLSKELGSPIRLVTHHWSTNPKKGFDIYEQLDDICKDSSQYEFTYIGRKPEDINFLNYFAPLEADAISKELPNYDIYVTASKEEAGANHVVEALACGLPVIYHEEGGSILNYCEGYGLKYYNFEGLKKNIEEITSNYGFYKEKVLGYDKTNQEVVDSYLNFLEQIQEGNQ
mgnify:CR=1 FL=1